MSIPKRYFLGAALAACAVGGALAFGVVGALDAPETEVVRFTRGTSLAPGEDVRIASLAARVVGEPRLMVHVLGHTGEIGDATANLALSRDRAQAVADRLVQAGLPQDRLSGVEGIGGAEPLSQLDGEGDREYQRRLARVTLQVFVSR